MDDSTIDCESFRAQSELLLTGALPEEERSLLMVHAQGCPDCGLMLRTDESLRQGLRKRWDTPKAPRRLRRRMQRRWALQRGLRTAGAVASIGAIGMVAIMLVPERQDAIEPLLSETLAIHQGLEDLPHDVAEEPADRVERFVSKQLGQVVNLPRPPELGRSLSARVHRAPTGEPAAVITYGGGAKRVTVLAVSESDDLEQGLPEPIVRTINGREVLVWKKDGTVFSATGADGRAPNPFVKMVGYTP
ncbi:MAG TPA: hypothetical protein DEB46_09030 [Myxococcales bacterium]|nr:hypothetical protein [Myxococcales bacterium]HBU48441.1 hypothetical protein [Myxococcales bacterium]